MAKGKTNQPLVIMVADVYKDSPPVQSLIAQGHRVYQFSEPCPADVDLILHPAAHQWNDMMWDFLPAALTAARKRKKEGKA